MSHKFLRNVFNKCISRIRLRMGRFGNRDLFLACLEENLGNIQLIVNNSDPEVISPIEYPDILQNPENIKTKLLLISCFLGKFDLVKIFVENYAADVNSVMKAKSDRLEKLFT